MTLSTLLILPRIRTVFVAAKPIIVDLIEYILFEDHEGEGPLVQLREGIVQGVPVDLAEDRVPQVSALDQYSV